ncbi:MAG: hypothetical protein IPK80_22800 [Nannocystis sp.]|nr:hypothetical protein [Nannocystis sp.]
MPRSRLLPQILVLCLGVGLCVASACKHSSTEASGEAAPPAFAAAVTAKDPIAVYEALERLIGEQRDSRDDRQFAYDSIQSWSDDGSPAYAFARAAVAGRLVEKRGLQAGELVAEVESYIRRCRESEPDFREGAATRMLGTLYVLAPARLLKHGDSEAGLELLEAEVMAHPERLEGHLRLAEAYVAFGESDPAMPHLCAALAGEARLGADDRRLLARLIADAGGAAALGCSSGAPS